MIMVCGPIPIVINTLTSNLSMHFAVVFLWSAEKSRMVDCVLIMTKKHILLHFQGEGMCPRQGKK